MDGQCLLDRHPTFLKIAAKRLAEAANVWLATVRKDGRPHLVPVWFVFIEQSFWVCVAPDSVKARNISANPGVVLALEDGSTPLICEGIAASVETPWSKAVVNGFHNKYDWDILSDTQYGLLLNILPTKLLSW